MIREQVLGIVAMEPMGEYSANVKYEKLNIVTYNGSTYSALKDTLGNEPTNDEYWQLIAKKGDKGDTYVMTEEDKEEVISEITDNANSVFNQNVDEKTNTFNNNANKKTTTFNTNSTNKTNDYNTNASSKLGAYNENATSKLEDYNSNAEAKINEYNNNANELIDSVSDTRNELERVKNDVLETGEASGNYLHLEDSTMAELQELEVSLNESQKQYTGQQLYDYEDMITMSEGITIDDEGWITATYDNTDGTIVKYLNYYTNNLNLLSNTRYNVFIEIKEVTGNGLFVPYSYNEKQGQFTTINQIFFASLSNGTVRNSISTTRESLEEIECGIRTFIQFNTGQSGSITFRLSVIADTTIIPDTFVYEPYVGGTASPNPEYPQEMPVLTTETILKSIGKNLFDKDNSDYILKQTNINSTTKLIAYVVSSTSVYIPCKPNTTYKISKMLSSRFVVGTTKETPAIDIPVNNIIRNDAGEFITINTDSSDKYIVAWVYTATYDTSVTLNEILDSIQIEEGSTQTEYEPYQESVLNLPIPENEFVGYINDDIKDQFKVAFNEEDGAYHLYLDKMLGKVVLNGSENISRAETTVYDEFRFNINIQGVADIGANDIVAISDKFKSVSRTNTYNQVNGISEGNNLLQIFYDEFKKMTANEFKTWLSKNNTTVCYLLAEPYTLDLGAVDMPLSYDGVTNIFVDTDLLMNINAKYYRNFTETVRNLQINNDTLKNELINIESRLTALENAQVSVVSESEVVE